MYFVGIDPSTKTGLVVLQSTEKDQFTQEYAGEISAKKGLTGMPRALAIAGMVLESLEKYADPKEEVRVCIEGYGFGNAHTLALLVEIGTMIRYSLMTLELSYQEVSPPALKKMVTGTGNAKKDKIMLELYKRWGLEYKSDNIADAAGLALYSMAAYGSLSLPQANASAVRTN